MDPEILVTKTWPIFGRRPVPNGIQACSVPDMSIIVGLIDAWTIIGLTLEDWRSEAERYQREIDGAPDEEERITLTGAAILEIRPRFIQCLFTYITFFLMLENGYRLIRRQLQEFNRKYNLGVSPGKVPKRSPLIQKVVTVRNHSIAHWADPEQRSPIDSKAGLYWGLELSGDDIQTMRFGRGHVAGAKPRELGSIPEVHVECYHYLLQWDQECAAFLRSLKSTLPRTEEGWEYTDIDTWKRVGPDGTRIGPEKELS